MSISLFNNPAYLNAGWVGKVNGKVLAKGQWKISAWAFDAKAGKTYKLDINHPSDKKITGISVVIRYSS